MRIQTRFLVLFLMTDREINKFQTYLAIYLSVSNFMFHITRPSRKEESVTSILFKLVHEVPRKILSRNI